MLKRGVYAAGMSVLNKDSNILVIGCEGNADVKLYKELLSKGRN